MEIIKVVDVYGDTHNVCKKSFEAGRTQVKLFTKNGKRSLSEYYEAMGWKGRATTIHKENIVRVA
jgi:hypothetical protein